MSTAVSMVFLEAISGSPGGQRFSVESRNSNSYAIKDRSASRMAWRATYCIKFISKANIGRIRITISDGRKMDVPRAKTEEGRDQFPGQLIFSSDSIST